MVRSLWTAATGMNAQQTNVDTIANNLANVNPEEAPGGYARHSYSAHNRRHGLPDNRQDLS